MKRRAILLALLLLALLASIGVEQIARREKPAALAAALPHVANSQVCAAKVEAGQTLHHAGVVIVFPDGTETYCVAFAEDELSGQELLQRTGLALVLSGFGGLGSGVCRIDDVGCSDPGNCFCQCQGADCHYWTYFRLDGETWRIQSIGISTRRVHDGDVDGWVWGNGHTPPGAASLGKLCAAVRPTPASTATSMPSRGGGDSPLIVTPPLSSGTVPNSGGSKSTPSGAGQAAAATPLPTKQLDPAATAAPRVIRQSSRPTSEVAGAQHSANGDGGGGLPVGLLAFAGVAAGLIVVVGGFAVRSRLRG